MVYSIAIPYDESVVKDRTFVPKGSAVDQIITDLGSCNWDKQNPAMLRFKAMQPDLTNKNQQFIIGRNILQASGYAYNATNFIDDLANKLDRYNIDGENHILNGILYEIYFDNNGDFRKGKFKTNCIEKIFPLRYRSKFEKSFEFIGELLAPYISDLYYIPKKIDTAIDVDILARKDKKTDRSGNEKECQIIESIYVQGKNITQSINNLSTYGHDSLYLKQILTDFLVAPEELINLNENIQLTNLYFDEPEDTLFQ
jgi:hypothetical protein